ncbi:MAG: PPC domain-containing protein [Deinococcota bacterium]
MNTSSWFKCLVGLLLLGLSASVLAQSGFKGTIVGGQTIESTLVSVDGFGYHTYSFTVPEGVSGFSVFVDGKGNDLDLAVQAGGPVVSYDEADYSDLSEEQNPSYSVNQPMPNTIYNIEIVNAYNDPLDYGLTLTTVAGDSSSSAAPLESINQTMGFLTPGLRVDGFLGAEEREDFAGWHSYIVNVPEGSSRLHIEVRGQRNIDMAVKYGSEILSYDDKNEGGDWDERKFGIAKEPTVTINNPEPGLYYIDVVNRLEDSSTYDIIAEIR